MNVIIMNVLREKINVTRSYLMFVQKLKKNYTSNCAVRAYNEL